MEILLYAWSDDLEEWVKVQCDEDGNLLIDLAGINLDDLGDVNAPTPADGEFLMFDSGSGEWVSHTLADADIPATIARDSEVTAAIVAHTANASAHHSRYTDAEAVTAMGAKADNNPLHHDRYTDGEAQAVADAQIATHTADEDAHHTPYTDADADERIALHAALASAHHTRYTDAEAVTAMGAKANDNPLHHDRYSDAEVDARIALQLGQGARVYHDDDQEITSGVPALIAFNSERYDTDSIHDNSTNNSRLTCKTAGKYLIVVNASIDFDTVAGAWQLMILINQTTIIYKHIDSVPASGSFMLSFAAIDELSVNDFVEVWVVQTSGDSAWVVSGANYTPEFMMQRIG